LRCVITFPVRFVAGIGVVVDGEALPDGASCLQHAFEPLRIQCNFAMMRVNQLGLRPARG
jgi:hypothetical protein